MKIGSLFSGIGGLERGLELAGVGSVVWQAECDPYASAVLAKHWPTVKRYTDVKEIDEQAERVDLICGGFPCQDISNAGKRAGIDGAKSGLWAEYARIIRVLSPRFVFIENVAALVNRGLGRVLGDLSALGFDAEWTVVSAADAGAPHERERIFILAHSNKEYREAWVGSKDVYHWQGEVSRVGDTELPGVWVVPAPGACGSDDGIPSRVDRLECLGNAVVSQQAALAWKTLAARIAQ